MRLGFSNKPQHFEQQHRKLILNSTKLILIIGADSDKYRGGEGGSTWRKEIFL